MTVFFKALFKLYYRLNIDHIIDTTICVNKLYFVVVFFLIFEIIQMMNYNYFFFRVKNERFFGSSLRPGSGSVCDLPAPPAAPSSWMATWLIALTH